MQGEYEGEDVVGDRLGEAIEWVECVASIRSWHDPFVMWFMQSLINQGMMKTAMDQVDPEIGKKEEYRKLSKVVPEPGAFCRGIVELGVAMDFGEEERRGEKGHHGKGGRCLGDFHADLVFEEFRVFEGCFVKDEYVGQGREYEVDY